MIYLNWFFHHDISSFLFYKFKPRVEATNNLFFIFYTKLLQVIATIMNHECSTRVVFALTQTRPWCEIPDLQLPSFLLWGEPPAVIIGQCSDMLQRRIPQQCDGLISNYDVKFVLKHLNRWRTSNSTNFVSEAGEILCHHDCHEVRLTWWASSHHMRACSNLKILTVSTHFPAEVYCLQ